MAGPGVSVRGIDRITHRTGYRRRGRTLDKLRIDQMSVTEVMHHVNEGGEMA